MVSIHCKGTGHFALTVGWIGSSGFFSLFSAIFFFAFFIFSFFTDFFIRHKTFCTLKNTTSEIWVRMKSRVVNFSTTRHSIFLSKKKGYFASCHSCMFATYNHCRTVVRSKNLKGSFMKGKVLILMTPLAPLFHRPWIYCECLLNFLSSCIF